MDYKNGKIYKIINDVNDLIYIGSTTQSLSRRFSEHKKDNIRKLQFIIYKAFKEIGVEHFKIILIEEYPCENRDQLRAREQYYIELFKSNKNGYNKYCAKRSRREYYENNKDLISTKYKEYYDNNKNRMRLRGKNYYENNKEKIKEYHEEHKEHKKLIFKQWSEKNKEKIKERIFVKVLCEICNIEITKKCMLKHTRSKKHIDNLKLKNAT